MFKFILGLFKKKPKHSDFPVKKTVVKKTATTKTKRPTVKKATTRPKKAKSHE